MKNTFFSIFHCKRNWFVRYNSHFAKFVFFQNMKNNFNN
jgi:hypothetical protein